MGSVKRWVLLIAASCIIFLPVLAAAGTVELPQTGLTACIDSSGAEITCAGTGQDGDIQAGLPWPSPRFTDNLDGTISDSLTGLMWAKDADAPTVGSCTGGPRSWQLELNYVTCLNGISYQGYNDWRLPNVNEHESLVNIGVPNTSDWLNALGFINVKTSCYWTSTTLASNTSFAWSIQFGGVGSSGGSVINSDKGTDSCYVLPVRQ